MTEEINEVKIWFFEKVKKNWQNSSWSHQEKRKWAQINKIRKERGEITANITEIQRITREYYEQLYTKKFSSVQFSRSVLSDSLRPHESQHARPPCPSPTPRVYSNSCPSSRWRHPAISSSAVPFSSCPQSLPASGSFPMSQLFAWGGQSIGVSASASVLPMDTQD